MIVVFNGCNRASLVNEPATKETNISGSSFRIIPNVVVGVEETEQAIGLVWGDAVDGLRAAVQFIPEKESYSLGERVEVQFQVQNVSARDIQIASSEMRQDCAFARDEDGNEVRVDYSSFSGRARIVRHILEPGEVVVLKSFSLGFGDTDDRAFIKPISKPYTSSVVQCAPGNYYVHYLVRLPDIDRVSYVDAKDNVPQPGDWQGFLQTGHRNVEIAERQESDLERFKVVFNLVSMQSAILRLARKYRVRVCFEQIDFYQNPAARSSNGLITGTFSGPSMPKLLDALCQSTNGQYTWTKHSRTYVVYPVQSHLMFTLDLNISMTPLEEVVSSSCGKA